MSRTNALNGIHDTESVRRLYRQIDQVHDVIARLSGSNVAAADFFQILVARTLSMIEGIAAAVWLRNPHGSLQIQHQVNVGRVGLDDRTNGRQAHDGLLRYALESRQQIFFDPDSKVALPDGTEAANYTAYPIVLSPILTDQGSCYGLLEVWLDAHGDAKLRELHLGFITTMSGYATNYLRNNTALRNTIQEQVFTQLEAFSRQIHASLNPTEVAFLVANEGRRLIGCDRISVGVRYGRHTTIEAVSGSDIVEKASVQVKKMRELFDSVLDWNERLVYRGVRDTTLPAGVLTALDAYLAESNAKLLVLQPLHDEREHIKDKEKETRFDLARSALLLEAFEPQEMIDPMMQRFGIISGHAASALYNAAELKRIPFGLLWKPMMALQSRAGGKRRFYTLLGLGLFTLVMLAMIFIPAPLKLDAKGQLVPEERHYIYPTGAGRVLQFKVNQGQTIRPNTPVAILFDRDLVHEIEEKLSDIHKSEETVKVLNSQSVDTNIIAAKRKEKADELDREQTNLKSLKNQLDLLLAQRNASAMNPGEFTVYAPEFRRARNSRGPTTWKIVSADFQSQLVNKYVRPVDPLLRVGNTAGAWQIEQKIPQKHVSQLWRAFKTNSPNEYLEVDVLLTSAATRSFKGRLYRRDITAEAVQNKDDHNESEFVVYAYVRVNDPDMAKEDHIPPELLTTGVEVHTKILCGDHSLGYSLFHGAWEFFYEHVIFFF